MLLNIRDLGNNARISKIINKIIKKIAWTHLNKYVLMLTSSREEPT